MAFESFADLVNMCYVAPIGDTRCHGGYVWSAYGIALIILAGNLVAPLRRARQVKRNIKRKLRREEAHES